MNREVHVRFWEGLGVRFPRATQLYAHWARDDVVTPCSLSSTVQPQFFGLRSAKSAACGLPPMSMVPSRSWAKAAASWSGTPNGTRLQTEMAVGRRSVALGLGVAQPDNDSASATAEIAVAPRARKAFVSGSGDRRKPVLGSTWADVRIRFGCAA